MTKKKRPLKGPLNLHPKSAEVITSAGRREFHETYDKRLADALETPSTQLLSLWCQENREGRECDSYIGEYWRTTEGELWIAIVEGLAPWDKAFRQMPGFSGDKESQIYAEHTWLDGGIDEVEARCKRHGSIPVNVSALRAAVAAGKDHAQRKAAQVTFY